MTRIATARLAALLFACLASACAGEVEDDDQDELVGESTDEIRGSFPVGTKLQTTGPLNHRESPSPSARILQVIPRGTIVASASASPRAGWYGITWNGKTGWVDGKYLSKPTATGGSSDAAGVLSLHGSGAIQLWDQTFGRRDGADPLSNIRDAAAGRSAKTSCYGGAPCNRVQLSSRLVSGMAKLRQQYGYRYFVTAIAGASHSAGSYHYAGRAIDVDQVNGVKIQGNSSLARGFMSACSALGAIEVLGPSNRSDHQDHIHCAF
jgi:hypothetical protein